MTWQYIEYQDIDNRRIVWEHIKVVVNDGNSQLYVNQELALDVERILPISPGKIGLFVDIGTEGYFKNIEVSEIY